MLDLHRTILVFILTFTFNLRTSLKYNVPQVRIFSLAKTDKDKGHFEIEIVTFSLDHAKRKLFRENVVEKVFSSYVSSEIFLTNLIFIILVSAQQFPAILQCLQ